MSVEHFSFTSREACDSSGRYIGRLGTLSTPHGVVQTPEFVFCATKGAIKAVDSRTMEKIGAQIILSNTYHLSLSPGEELIHDQGGLHHFMNWNKPLMTDSGGYQIFAMGHGSVSGEIKGIRNVSPTLLGVEEEGATFSSYIDGRRINLTPERAMEIQGKLGADLVVQLDVCTPYNQSKKEVDRYMQMSQRWGLRSINTIKKLGTRQAIYGVVQGGVYKDLRGESADFLSQSNFCGNAIGGSLGASQKEMHQVISWCMEALPRSRPSHLLGIGDVETIFFGVGQGIDTFDCVYPTRAARHGWALIPYEAAKGKGERGGCYVNVRNSVFGNDRNCLHEANVMSNDYSAAYIHHLLRCKEILGLQILSQHNVFAMVTLMQQIRDGLAKGNLNEVRSFWIGDS